MPGVVDRKLKGTIFIGYANYIKRKGGLDALERCSKVTGMDLTKLVDEKWYPDILSANVISWVAANYGREGCRAMGMSTVAERGVISVAARLIGVKKVLASAQNELRDTINFGEVGVEFTDSGATMTFRDMVKNEAECDVWMGVLGLMKISGSKGTVAKTACQVKGAAACTYELTWK
jgi:uncharacterized protein (TIGR02265 family)